MAEYEEKFIVINRKHLKSLGNGIRRDRAIEFQRALDKIANYLPDNKYYVCNQDEPYAEKVLQTILEGEDQKANSGGNALLGKAAPSPVLRAEEKERLILLLETKIDESSFYCKKLKDRPKSGIDFQQKLDDMLLNDAVRDNQFLREILGKIKLSEQSAQRCGISPGCGDK